MAGAPEPPQSRFRRFHANVRLDPHYKGLLELEMLLAVLKEVPHACSEIARVLAKPPAADAGCGPTLTRDLLELLKAEQPPRDGDDPHRRALMLMSDLGKLP